MAAVAGAQRRALVWDLPVRLFHWSLLAMTALAWRTAETRDLPLHRIAGCAVVGLLVFRVWWGVFGSSTARFSAFLRGPGAVFAYARSLLGAKSGKPEIGHNPMGGWSVAALLSCLAVITVFGLFSVDTDGLESGPFAAYVSFDAGRAASKIHALAFDALEALVALHILAILFYAVAKRQNLLGPMVTGRKTLDEAAPDLSQGSPIMLAVGVALGGGVAAALAHLGGAF